MGTTHEKAAEVGDVICEWWMQLQFQARRGRIQDLSDVARLRRTGTISDALTDPTTMRLIKRISEVTGWPPHAEAWWTTPAAVAAVTLAHLPKAGPLPLATVLGQISLKEKMSRYSDLRFTRLIRAESDSERFNQLVRAALRVRMDDVAVEVGSLARDIFRLWSSPDAVRRDWIFQYYQMMPTVPNSAGENEEAR